MFNTNSGKTSILFNYHNPLRSANVDIDASRSTSDERFHHSTQEEKTTGSILRSTNLREEYPECMMILRLLQWNSTV